MELPSDALRGIDVEKDAIFLQQVTQEFDPQNENHLNIIRNLERVIQNLRNLKEHLDRFSQLAKETQKINDDLKNSKSEIRKIRRTAEEMVQDIGKNQVKQAQST